MKFRGVNAKKTSQPVKPFQGEMMTCKHCGRQQRSNPNKSSQWTAVEIDGGTGLLYFCPECFGNAKHYS